MPCLWNVTKMNKESIYDFKGSLKLAFQKDIQMISIEEVEIMSRMSDYHVHLIDDKTWDRDLV